MLIIKNFFIPFLFDVNLFKMRSPKRARRLLIVLIEEITRFRDIVRGCFEKCVFASISLFVEPTKGERECVCEQLETGGVVGSPGTQATLVLAFQST